MRSQSEQDQRELLLRLLPMSGSLAGLCIGALTLFRFAEKGLRVATLADDLLVICAALFLCATYLIFWALRTDRTALIRRLARIVDLVFLIALTGLVGVGFLMVYTFF